MSQKPIPKSVILGLLHSMVIMDEASMIEATPKTMNLGYTPTVNKHTAKRQKRKLARRKNTSSKASVKPFNQRNKKGKP